MDSGQYADGRYLEKVADWHAGDSPWKARKVAELLRRGALAPASVLEVGCGAGGVLAELQGLLPGDVSLRGYDVSPQALSLARPKENARLRFFRQDVLAAPPEPADLVLLLDVFEHVPDYLGFLRGLRPLGRRFAFHVPLDACAQAISRGSGILLEMRRHYGHLHYFTKDTALATLADAGYGVLDWFYTDDQAINPPPARLRRRAVHEVRRALFAADPDLAAWLFWGYNVMVLAEPRG